MPVTRSTAQTLLYLTVFGIGSMLGMVGLSFVVSLPFNAAGRYLGRIGLGLQALLGTADLAIGAWGRARGDPVSLDQVWRADRRAQAADASSCSTGTVASQPRHASVTDCP